MDDLLAHTSKRMKRAAEQLALAAYDESNVKAAALSSEAVDELRHLHSLADTTVKSMQELLAAAKASARLTALQNAISIHDKAEYIAGTRLMQGSNSYERFDAAYARSLALTILFAFTAGSNTYTFTHQYSTYPGNNYGYGSEAIRLFNEGRQPFCASLARTIQRLTGMPTASQEVDGSGAYTITITPP